MTGIGCLRLNIFHRLFKLINELSLKLLLQFEEGIEKTLTWFLENISWLTRMSSRKYQEYYQKMYNKKTKCIKKLKIR
jgi:dTDP-D-glucose 4,6-dehydratase